VKPTGAISKAILASSVGATLVVPALTTDAQTVTQVRVGDNYRLRADGTTGRGRDVPGLAVNPSNPQHIVEVDVEYLNGECDFRVSFDGGATWTGGHLRAKQSGENPPFPDPPCLQNFDSGGYAHSNASVVFGSGQNVYTAFSSHRGPFNRPEGGCVPPCPPSGPQGGAGDDSLVARSVDGGRSFQPAVRAVAGGPNPQPFFIRPQVAVQPGGGSAGADRIYVAAWECHIKLREPPPLDTDTSGRRRLGGCSGGGGERRMVVARSDDGGLAWTTPVIASARNVRTDAAAIANAASADEQVREPSQPVVGPDGAVYLAYRNRDLTPGTTCPFPPTFANCIVVARSTDLGQTWQHFHTGVPLGTAFVGHPRLAIDPTRGGPTGTLYVVYQAQTAPGDNNIVFQKSTDAGVTWSNAPSGLKINDDTTPQANQSNPWVSVAPNGRVDVVWHDQRNRYSGPPPTTRGLGDIYYAWSTDQGASFSPNRRITDRTFNRDVGLTGVGGYTWYGPTVVPIGSSQALVAWTDSREGDFNTGIQDVYLATVNVQAGVTVASRSLPERNTAGLSALLAGIAYPGGPEGVGGIPINATKVVIVNQEDNAAAMAAAVLSRANHGPLLATPSDVLPDSVRRDVARMEPTAVFLIGDSSKLSGEIINQLGRIEPDIKQISRLVGANPPDTARVIAINMDARTESERVGNPSATPPAPPRPAFDPVIIANPNGPEAAAAIGLAASLRLAILFVEKDSIPAPTREALSALAIRNSLVIGGPESVSQAVVDQLKADGRFAEAPQPGGQSKRLGPPTGSDAYVTSKAVAAEANARAVPVNNVYVADATRSMEAALAGATVSRVGGVMLLTPNADPGLAQVGLNDVGIRTAADRVVVVRGLGPVAEVGTTSPTPGAGPPADPPARALAAGAEGASEAQTSVAPSRRRSTASFADTGGAPSPLLLLGVALLALGALVTVTSRGRAALGTGETME
jgi:putative cell wall-binding protein